MKKIVVAFDGSMYSESALNYALELSEKEKDNLIVGVFIQDLSYIYMISNYGLEPHQYTPTQEFYDQMMEGQEEQTKEYIQSFTVKCKAAGANFKVHVDKGITLPELITESAFTDLIMIGYQTYFSSPGSSSKHVLKDLLKEAKCPVLVVPEEPRTVDEVIFTFDGQESAAYAIRQYTYLLKSNYPSAKYTLLSIVEDEDEDVPNESMILEYLNLYYTSISYEKKTGKASGQIHHYAEQCRNCLLVMGAYGRGTLSRLFSSSKAKNVLEAASIPAFITHD